MSLTHQFQCVPRKRIHGEYQEDFALLQEEYFDDSIVSINLGHSKRVHEFLVVKPPASEVVNLICSLGSVEY